MRILLILIAATLLLPLTWVAFRPPAPDAPDRGGRTAPALGVGVVRRLHDGSLFDAAPNAGARQGRVGVLLTPDGTLRGGTFDPAWRLHGTGWSRSPDGGRYDGEHEHGARAGAGVAVAPDGAMQAGRWDDGGLAGPGHRVLPNGRRFSGAFVDGRPEGRGWCFEGSAVRACEAAEAPRAEAGGKGS